VVSKRKSCFPKKILVNTDYEIVIYREEDYWVAEAPECPGCATHGDTRQNALTSIEELIPKWIGGCERSGYPIPEPKGRIAFA
jgi:predicted RNase H-like HicB family nuclease